MDLFDTDNRPLRIETPLGENHLLLLSCRGEEAISELFRYELHLLAPIGTPIPFERLLGQSATVTLRTADGQCRVNNGILVSFAQGTRDEQFTHYEAELAPRFWLWRLKRSSRIFQHLSVPDILQQVLDGLDVSWQIAGTYPPRDYCVQYRETDFDFANRLMEEEGIYYYFEHRPGGHALVLTDHQLKLPQIDGNGEVIYEELEGGLREETRVRTWFKRQTITSSSVVLRDHCFQLTGQDLQAEAGITKEVACGQVTHHLQAGEDLEQYDYPGGYAGRFDDVDPSGTDCSADLAQVYEESNRTAMLRLEQQTQAALVIQGESNCVQFRPGHKFRLTRHYNGNGTYLLVRVRHQAEMNIGLRSDQDQDDCEMRYENQFTCLPEAITYRPLLKTPKPKIAGLQTATVVGPPGEEIYVDKYGRIRVQFHWDREGALDVNSSCWIRVAQVWAGPRWGAFFWPRIGHEVVVSFAEGNPDEPLVVGSVYNSANMPPLNLPGDAQKCGIKSCIYTRDPNVHFNAIVFHDSQETEYIQIHSETHEMSNSKADKLQYAPCAQYSFQAAPKWRPPAAAKLRGIGHRQRRSPSRETYRR